MCKIRIAGVLLITALILLVACVPASLPPSAPTPPALAPAPPVEVPPQEEAPINHAPNTPSNPSPSNHATDVSTITLSWSGGDLDPDDTVTYDVYFGSTSAPPLVSSHQSATEYYVPPSSLPMSPKYYWKVVATDNHRASTEGPVWAFTMKGPDREPFITACTPTGPFTGEVNEALRFSTSASSNVAGTPEYRFDWGDGNCSSWASLPSASHSWASAGTYTVRAQARHPSITSEWSSGKQIRIEPKSVPGPESLSRSPFGQPEVMMSYITPDAPEIEEAVEDILSGEWRWAYNDFNALREWVAMHVSYVSDQSTHGTSEYWQLPAETLNLGTGDCEDFAILLCTLLRAYGVPPDQVYVAAAFSEGEEDGHAFLFERCYKDIWRAIEPQADVWYVFLLGDIDASEYDRFYCFNDQGYLTDKPTLPQGEYEFEVDYSFYPATRGASVEFERHLSAGERVTGCIEWGKDSLGEYSNIVYDWTITAYDQYDNAVFTWSGTELSHEFSFTAPEASLYRIEILKRDYLARCATMTIEPPDWVEK